MQFLAPERGGLFVDCTVGLGGHSEALLEASPATRVVYLPHRNDVVRFLGDEVRAGDLVVTMGCGDVWMLGDAALERIREAS